MLIFDGFGAAMTGNRARTHITQEVKEREERDF